MVEQAASRCALNRVDQRRRPTARSSARPSRTAGPEALQDAHRDRCNDGAANLSPAQDDVMEAAFGLPRPGRSAGSDLTTLEPTANKVTAAFPTPAATPSEEPSASAHAPRHNVDLTKPINSF
jgi:hypothetical protein